MAVRIKYLKELREYRAWYGLRGLMLAAKSKWGPPETLTKVKPPNIAHPVRLRTLSTDISIYHQVFIKSDFDLDLAREPVAIIDCGAYAGFTAVYFANRYPRARVIAVEPEMTNYSLLVQNAAPYPRITPLRAAVWGANTDVWVVDPGHGHWGFRVRDSECGDSLPVIGNAPAVTVDRIMADYDIGHVDILKVDIEGAEKEVFADASRWIGKVGVIIVEVHERFRPGCRRSVYDAAVGFDFLRQKEGFVCFARKAYVPERALLAARASEGASAGEAEAAPLRTWLPRPWE
jgi:FkbM family methyltransferase